MLEHTLLNPNQLPHYENQFQDNSMSESHLSIISEDGEFSIYWFLYGNSISVYNSLI